jgi:hypothetical protein
MPTRLGNILRAAEMYSFERYGMDSVVLWTRLSPLLPKESGEGIDDSRTAMDFMLNVSALAGFLGIAWGVYFVFIQQWLFVIVAILALLLARLAYGNALHAARAYGEIIKTCFDLYRWKLLDALHIPHPKTSKDEPPLWEKVSEFIYRGFPLQITYDTKAETSKQKETKD